MTGFSEGREMRRYGEPTFAISQPLLLLAVSLPGPGALDSFEESISATDFIIESLKEGLGRTFLHLWILPDRDDPVPPDALAAIRYEGWFRIAIATSLDHPPVQPGAELAVLTAVPSKSLFPNQVVDRNQAIGFFHKKITASQGVVCYWNPNKLEFRVIFSVAMRVPPRLEFDFGNPSLHAEVLKCTETEASFAVVGPAGRLSLPPPLIKLFADAEL